LLVIFRTADIASIPPPCATLTQRGARKPGKVF
jgi:hypothetical protein